MGKETLKKDITYEELKTIFKEVLDEYFDPDYGMELRKDFKKILEKSIKDKREKRTQSFYKVKKDFV